MSFFSVLVLYVLYQMIESDGKKQGAIEERNRMDIEQLNRDNEATINHEQSYHVR